MDLFSNDVDLLKFEPGLFSGSYFPGQVLCKGANGVLSGTTFTASGENFTGKGVAAGGVIFLQSLDGMINAAYEIVSVNSATQLTISIVRGDSEQAAIPVGNASGLIYRIATFAPQAVEAMVEITTWIGLRPGAAEAGYGVEDIFDIKPLHLLSAYRVLVMIFATLCGTEEGTDKTYTQKRDYYLSLYNSTLQRIRIALDTNHDGTAEKIITGGSVRLVRE
jgi:hypothetical protein